MYKVKRPCRVCGKLFTPCVDCENDKTAFHWRSVACSHECARKYFEQVEMERKKDKERINVNANVSSTNTASPPVRKRTRKTANNKEKESE